MLGLSAWKSGDPSRAEQAFKTALAADSSYQKARTSLARVEARQQDPSVVPIDLGVAARQFVEMVQHSGEEESEHGGC